MARNLDKHKKYKNSYKPNDFFWGLGIEHETYIETSKLKQITLKSLKENRARERYSVNYYSVYNTESFNNAIDGIYDSNDKILIPILINSHTFQKTDIYGEHQTTYERIPKQNTLFSGKSMFEWMKEHNPLAFKDEYEHSFLFDGDTIEFITQQFYKATVDEVIKELINIQEKFIYSLNSLPKEGIIKTYEPFQLSQKNYSFASYITNLKHNAMFNNGTIHINITLPTKLNTNAEIENFDTFKENHQNFARVLQWISPLLIAKYGSPDPLCESKHNGVAFSAASQRVAISRYIGLGTYDTDNMEVGKILTRKKEDLKNIYWYEAFYKDTDYVPLNDIGMDINFNKHYNHGIEFRILDSIPIKELEEILKLIVHLADFSLDNTVQNPTKSKLWHIITKECVHNGKGYNIDIPEQNELLKTFNIESQLKEPIPCIHLLEIISEKLRFRYKNGLCVNTMIQKNSTISKPETIKEVEHLVKIAPIVEKANTRCWYCI